MPKRQAPFEFQWRKYEHVFPMSEQDIESKERRPLVFTWGSSIPSFDYGPGAGPVENITLPQLSDPRYKQWWPHVPDGWMVFVGGYRGEYDPRQVPNLHREFTEHRLDTDWVLSLARAHGPLGRYIHQLSAHTIAYFRALERDGYEMSKELSSESWSARHGVFGERPAHWLAALHKLKSLMALWEASVAVDSKSNQLLLDAVPPLQASPFDREVKLPNPPPHGIGYHRVGGSRAREWALETLGWEWDKTSHVHWVARWKLLELEELEYRRTVAKFFVTEQVNLELTEGTAYALDPVKPGRLRLAPLDLLGYLYLCFAREMAGGSKDWRLCPGCENWFPAKRPNQTCCDKSCRDKVDYRKNKAPRRSAKPLGA